MVVRDKPDWNSAAAEAARDRETAVSAAQDQGARRLATHFRIAVGPDDFLGRHFDFSGDRSQHGFLTKLRVPPALPGWQ
jgi:hypothetical protein